MSALADCAYAKMNGLGNEILVLDLRSTKGTASGAEIRALAPQFAFDQMMTIHAARRSDAAAFVRIYNADGSEAGACGNGNRCVAWFLLHDGEQDELRIETASGIIDCVRKSSWEFTVDMGRPRFLWNEIPLREPVADTSRVDLGSEAAEAGLGRASVVSMGNPHAIFWVEDFDRIDLGRVGPRLERHAMFPQRANISLARVTGRDRIDLKVWERGAGLTRACGTAACAALAAAARLDVCDRTGRVALPGGELAIEQLPDDHILMTGPCELESEGRLESALLAKISALASG
jgi:diaminopimelate epimerase